MKETCHNSITKSKYILSAIICPWYTTGSAAEGTADLDSLKYNQTAKAVCGVVADQAEKYGGEEEEEVAEE